MLTIELNMYHAVALGAFLLWLGGVITDKVSLLSRYCIPAPLVGGLCFSILNCILYSMGIASINFDGDAANRFYDHVLHHRRLHGQYPRAAQGQQSCHPVP